jgi:hypothetical protein
LKIKATKLVKGKGLEKTLAQGNCKALGIHAILNNSSCEET